MNVYKLIFMVALSIVISSCGGPKTPAEGPVVTSVPSPAILPLPASVEWGEQLYAVPQSNTICFNKGSEIAAEWIEQLLSKSNRTAKVVEGDQCGNWNITADNSLESRVGKEGYLLDISAKGVTLKAATETGLFYGIQTLRQLFPPAVEQGQVSNNPVSLRHVSIEDQPRFEWRGNMIDVARSFFGLDYLKEHVDRMAFYKLNRLHLHLTDDQGWRIEIKSKPKLTEIGSKGSVTDGRSGYLTQEEYKELQDYALARHIIIIPEIDMPGHIYSALVGYPELNCDEYANLTPAKATPPALYSGYEVGWSKLCLEKPEIYDFVSEVIGEMAEITKGPWIHIGGDEIDDPRYEEFVVKADSIVRNYGKTTIGWEEITKAEVSDSAISQNWHGKAESVVDLKIIESICTNFYFDHANIPGQENTLNWCKEDGVSIKDAYDFETDNPNVLGVEAPVWSEHVLTDQMMDDRLWPRTIAVAEIGWTPKSDRNFSEFIERLQKHASRLRAMGVHHYPTPEINWGQEETAENPGSVFSGFMPGK